MNWLHRLSLALALLMLGSQGAGASTSYGDLNNFDTVNDTGRECRGFQIEIDGARSTDITYTYDWNHYGPPRISEDNTDPANPKVFIRYESAKNPDGTWVGTARTDVPTQPLGPTDGHYCTDPTNYTYGCEHFGVGFNGTPRAVKYNWLHEDGTGNLALGAAVNVATPNWTYSPPVAGQPAQVIAVIPAPVVPDPAGKKFGEPSWVKVIKTTTHNAGNVALADLVSDLDSNGNPMWQNNEPAEIETEWKLLQTNNQGEDNPKAEAQGLPDDMGDGSETVTRRYEFYKYAAAANTIDGENGEAKCDEVNPTTDPNDPNYLHGLGESVSVTDANGITQYVNCAAQVVVGAFIGAQMAGFDAEAPLGLVDHLQDGENGVPYTPRTVVVGGDSPYSINITGGSLPLGLIIGADGVMSGTPTNGGDFSFTVEATDAKILTVSKAYTMKVAGGGVAQQFQLSVDKSGSGTGSVSGNGIDCGATCSVTLAEGTMVSLTATPAAGSVFNGWGGACTGTGICVMTLGTNITVTASFTQRYQLTINKSGSGTGTVTGNGINCGATCSVFLDKDTAVSLTALPDGGSLFTGWSGACGGTGACNTTMSADQLVTASFAPVTQQYTMTVTKNGSGTVTSSPKGINCGKRCSKTFATGTNVKLTAKPAKKHLFLGWSGGGCSGTSLTCTVPMLSDQNVSAQFN